MNTASKGEPASAKFTEGPVMRHTWVMVTSATLGITSLFIVDLIDMFFLSMLNDENIIAGAGFGGSLLYLLSSLSIAFAISVSALVSRALGQGDSSQAKRFMTNIIVFGVLVTGLLSLLVWNNTRGILHLLGADQQSLEQGKIFLNILIPIIPLVTAAMIMSEGIRSAGDAKFVLYATIISSVTNIILDPIFIFVLNLDIAGAAWATLISRFVLFLIYFYGITFKHKLVAAFKIKAFLSDTKVISNIVGPAALANLATPLSHAIVLWAIAAYGNSYVAAVAVIWRVVPVLFSFIIALSGAVGPIVGQNYGARLFRRVRATINCALILNIGYVAIVSGLLFIFQDPLMTVFRLQGQAAELVSLYCHGLVLCFAFNGVHIIASTVMNTLGKPLYAMGLDLANASIGTIPLVLCGGYIAGAPGVLMGQAASVIIFSLLAIATSLRLVKTLSSSIEDVEQTQITFENIQPKKVNESSI